MANCLGMPPHMRFVAVLLAMLLSPVTALATGYATYEPIVVAPPIERPAGPACVVTLLHGERFVNGEAAHKASYAPSCPGPWSKVVLSWRTRIAGRQYDRVGGLWIGGREFFRFTTAEPTKHGIDYTVEKDVTEYAPVLRASQTVLAVLGNYTNATYTGVYMIDATLTFYRGAAPRTTADDVLPVSNTAGDTPWFNLAKPTDEADMLVRKLPRNIEHARLDVFSTSHGCDEFWYTNQPDAYVAKHPKDGLCGGGAYREIDVWIDGTLAAAIYPFPWIYTGGINPILWRPLPAIDTLNIPAYHVDLDPFAGVLSDGAPHRIEIAVRNDRGSWPTDANLLLWRDPHATRTGGAITASASRIAETPKQRIMADGGQFATAARGSWSVAGYVNTAHGRVVHDVATTMTFGNAQTIGLSNGAQQAAQSTTFDTRTGAGHAATVHTLYYIDAASVYPPQPASGPYDLVIRALVSQGREVTGTTGRCAQSISANAIYKRAKVAANSITSGASRSSYTCHGSNPITLHSLNGSIVKFH